MPKKRSKFLSGKRIDPAPITPQTTLTDLVDESFLAYNAARLREACQLFTQKMLEPEVTVGLSITGALTPAGLGISALIPLIKAGFVDWIISTGANLYHDTHFGIGLAMHQGNAQTSDIVLRDEEVVRIYDIFFDYSVLLDTDAFFRKIIEAKEFQKPMSTAEFHYLCGRYVHERERKLGLKDKSLLAVAYEYAVPIYTSSPGDSSIGMNVAAKALQGNKLAFDPSLDVNETAAIVLAAKRNIVKTAGRAKSKAGQSAVFILGGGSPKNFLLQTEPQIQEVLGIDERGHDYFLQVTDARPDTGGLSGATPGEAVSWGKVDPDRLPDAVVCYLDSTVALPIITAYALAKHKPREPKRLYDRRGEFMNLLLTEYKSRSDGNVITMNSPTATDQATANYDCTKCPAYCCSIYERVQVTKRDITRLAKHFGVSYETALARYTRPYNDERVLRRKADPILGQACKFLNPVTRQCGIYHVRPLTCREYPETERCAYFDLIEFERAQQNDPDVLPLVKITFRDSAT